MSSKRFICNAARAFFLLVLMLVTDVARADEKCMCVVVYETKGTTAFNLAEKPIVTFVGEDVQLVSGEVTVLYSLDGYLKMTIEEKATDIQPTTNNTFRITDSQVTAYGCKQLALYTPDGKCLQTVKANAGGVATLFTATLNKGVYLVTTESKTFKISKNR